ncbi:MAG: phosphatidylserine decarboxylase family protein [Bacillota bacterium]
MKNQPLIVKDAVPYLAVLGLLTVGLYFVWPPLAVLAAILTVFTAFFFRNPPRTIPADEGILVSPADGVILNVSEIMEERFIKDKAVKVSIFLSVFNVHVNRCPMSGEIKYRSYRPGKFLPAYKGHASEINEKNYVGIENGALKILVTQITGFIARRIVCWVKPGDRVERGDLFGLIKFGSCTEIIMPVNVEILVKKGDKVVGGETIIGRIIS